MVKELCLGTTYNITTKTPTITGSTFLNVKLLGSVTDIRLAISMANGDPANLHISVVSAYADLNLNYDPNKMTWCIFQKQDGTRFVLAKEYIDLNASEITTTIAVSVDLTFKSEKERDEVLKALSGYIKAGV